MVQQSSYKGRCQRTVVIKDLWPFLKHSVGSNDDGATLISFADDLEQQIGTVLVDGQISGTRTAVIAAIHGMAFGLVSLTRLQLSKRIPVFVFFTLVFLILLPQVQTTRSFQRLGTAGNKIIEGDFTGRTDLWRAGLVSFAEHPLLGVG